MRYISRLVIALVLTGGLLAQMTARAEDQNILHIVSVDPSKFPLVAATVSYTTAQGAPVQPAPSFSVTVNGAPMAVTSSAPTPLPLAAAIVADLSARMDDQGSAYAKRFDVMLPLAQDFVSQLQGVQPGKTLASLVVMTETVKTAHEQIADVQKIVNTINNANPDVPFRAQTGGAAGAPYPLGDALLAGLKQLQAAPPDLPRLLVVFAAGDAQQQLNLAALRDGFAKARSEKRPISLLILGFGSDQPGSFTTFAANPTGLQQLATELGGSFIAVSGATISAATKRTISDGYAALLQRSVHALVSFTVNKVPAGAASVEISAAGSSDTQQIDLSNAPPRFEVLVDSRSFQDRVHLSIKSSFEQQPISEVEYFLNNLPIGAPVAKAPNFELEVNAYDPEFQKRFPPGSYELTAAARDATRQESRSERPLNITVFAPPPASFAIADYWWVPVLAVALAVVAGGMYLLRRRKSLVVVRPDTSQRDGDEPTRVYQNRAQPEPPSGANPLLDEATRTFVPNDDQTLPFEPGPGQAPKVRWALAITDGGQEERVELPHTRRYHDIGRVMNNGRQPHIAIKNPLVSQAHAKLELFLNDLFLVDEFSRNHTFLGEDKQLLDKGKRVQLKSGDVFWLSPSVKVRVESVTEQP